MDVDRLGIALQRGAVPVAVAPDEGAGQAGEVIEHLRAADVAAMDEEFRPAFAQRLDGVAHDLIAVVRIAEDPEQHRRECNQKARSARREE